MSVTLTRLKNGLTVASDHMPGVETISIGVWVKVGSRYEQIHENGMAHLLEHMMFKGTKTRTAYQIAEEVENVGGYINAYTSRENTAYYLKVLAKDLELAVSILSDVLKNSTFPEDELVREKSVVLQEIGQSYDTPDDIIFDHFQEKAFSDQPLGRPILGTTKTVQSFDRKQVNDFFKSHYTAPRMVLSAAGKVDHDTLVKLAETYFSSFSSENALIENKATYSGGQFIEEKDLEQIHFLVGFPGVQVGDEDYYPLNVFSSLFGGGMSSRLFQEIREKKGLVYSVYSFSNSYSNSGIFGVYAGTGPDSFKELLPTLGQCFKDSLQDLTEDEVLRAKTQLTANYLMGRESTSSRSEMLAQQYFFYGRALHPEEIKEKLEAVTREKVKNHLENMLSSQPTCAALGPVSGEEDFSSLTQYFA